MRSHIALGGFMGTGKSTLGKLVAAELQLEFVDLDQQIEARAGQPISAIFQQRGEDHFRGLELATLSDLLCAPPQLIALGGGTLHQPGCLRALEGVPVVVLHLQEQELLARLAASSQPDSRPLLARAGELYRIRAEGYARAGQAVDLTGLDVDAAVERLRDVVEDLL